MKILFLLVITVSFNMVVSAQHDHRTHSHPPEADTAKKQAGQKAANDSAADQSPVQDTVPAGHGNGHGDHDHGSMSMSHAFSRNLPMNRNGSGTSWLPDNSPMYGYMFHSGRWMYMLHGNVFIRYNNQDLFNSGTRGDSKFDIPSMVMLMGQRNMGEKGLFHFSAMLSADPILVGGEGYPLLFQTGESYKGEPLVDRQHPHDLFSELSVSYAHALSSRSDVFVYVGYPGEPALGPAAYVHRPSGFFNPDAPLTHHWVDATHITFGVATLGYRFNDWKLEGSLFTGREPDENRYDLDKPRFDSWSGRLSYNPNFKWAMQVSHGFLKEPEVFHPGEDVRRTTASVTYSTRGFGETFNNFTLLWGQNKVKGEDSENGILFEAARQQRRLSVYGRYEWVQKSGEELNLDHGAFDDHHALFPVHALTAGVGYDLLTLGKTRIAIGTQFSGFLPDSRLAPLYGDLPVAGQLYLRIYPRAMGSTMGVFYLPD